MSSYEVLIFCKYIQIDR